MPHRSILAICLCLLSVSSAPAQGFSSDEAAKRMKLPPGFSVRCVASEPMIRQPTSISFDGRGRLWVLQYLQYPNYAGLQPVSRDQYLRTVWDKVPEPPPFGPKGADKITILSDPDEHGVFRKARDFVTGLNIASGFCLGNGGVYVVQPPYLLFYADKNEDDVPDGDPEVLLEGFGMNDTHSLANSLQFGPDGWLYGATGSTSTSRIKNPAWRAGNSGPDSPEFMEFQQGVWRYHPRTKQFELFSEGGGNTYGLDFDRTGQVIAGTNWGGSAMLHQMQGAYYIKGFSKHGPLHNPNTYGYFEHVPYSGFKGGHVTCGGIIYQGDAYPAEYQNQYIAANLLSNAVYWHKIEPVSSSFKARHGGELIEANDTWFRPVDLLEGPDSCVYVVDFYDKRAAHLDPVDNWDKTNGRIYRIEYQGGPKYPTFDLRKKSSAELLELLKHPNIWQRRTARELIADRGDVNVYPQLRKWLLSEKGQLALESLWTLYCAGGWIDRDFDAAIAHENEAVRAWAIRFACDEGVVSGSTLAALTSLIANERSPVVLAQLACSARRLDPASCMVLVSPLLAHPLSAQDAQLPLLIWWAMETAITRDRTGGIEIPFPRQAKLQPFFIERLARRFLSGDLANGPERLGTIYIQASGSEANIAAFLRGLATALQGHPLEAAPPALEKTLAELRGKKPRDLLVLEVLARMQDAPARQTLREIVANAKESDAERVKAIDLLRQVRDPLARELFISELAQGKSDALKVGLIAGLEGFADPKIADLTLASYPNASPAVKRRMIQLLISRPIWAMSLMQELEAGRFPQADLTLDHARAVVALGDTKLTELIEKRFGKLAPATAGEKQARIASLNAALGREKNVDASRGKVLFTKLCASCHQLRGEGGKVGPDLTTADRKNRVYMLAQIVDPSGYIRPEFIVQNVLTVDDRKLSGIATESGESVVLVNVVNDQPIKAVIAKKDIAEIRPSAISLMPEKLLDSLSDAQVADLFAYLASDAPREKAKPQTEKKSPPKLTVGLVSGSFEYKSDASLASFQKYLEEHFPITCLRAFAKSEREISGLENLEKCDVVIFFTRRLTIGGDDLERVKKFAKSGKPIIGIRTASHGFQNWLAMDKEVFGGDYQNHYADKVVCDVSIVQKQKEHPVLKGFSSFRSNGTLYKNPNLAVDVTVLLTGSIPGHSEPVAWTREKDGRRVFYTSLGHPDDFQDKDFIRLLVNALAWTTKTDLGTGK